MNGKHGPSIETVFVSRRKVTLSLRSSKVWHCARLDVVSALHDWVRWMKLKDASSRRGLPTQHPRLRRCGLDRCRFVSTEPRDTCQNLLLHHLRTNIHHPQRQHCRLPRPFPSSSPHRTRRRVQFGGGFGMRQSRPVGVAYKPSCFSCST